MEKSIENTLSQYANTISNEDKAALLAQPKPFNNIIMRITDFKTAYDKLESEMSVAVLVASTYEYGYWKNYHASVYRVVNITPSEINFQNVNHVSEWLKLNKKNMKSGQFRIEY